MIPLLSIQHMHAYAEHDFQYMNLEAVYMRQAMKKELVKYMGTVHDDFGPMLVPGLTWIKQTRCIQVKHTQTYELHQHTT